MPKLIMMSAPSASGKSTLARELMLADSNMVRINRDELRAMSITKWTPAREGWIIDAEIALARAAAALKRNIVIDDTNLFKRDEDRWKGLAQSLGYTFEKKVLKVGLEECVERDLGRGKASIGRAAIERQFLRAGLIEWPTDKKIVIFDIDGTLADLQHRVAWIQLGADCPACKGQGHTMEPDDEDVPPVFVRCTLCEKGKIVKKNHAMFYDLVYDDEPIEAVVQWAQNCWEHYYVLIVSGRAPEKCAEDTIDWLDNHEIRFNHIFMRRANHHGPDDEEKQLILDDILKTLPKEQIAFVVDDRPNVVAMWKKNGIRVFPVRGRDDDVFYAPVEAMEAK